MDTTFSKELKLSNKFSLRVTPLPPYYIDFIDDMYPIPSYPKRAMKLVSGDVAYMDYAVPDEVPDPADADEFELYMRYKQVQQDRVEIEFKRNRVRRDFLLSNCVEVIDGPIDPSDEGWLDKVFAAFPDLERPDTDAARRLLFLKTQVITSSADFTLILSTAIPSEVTSQGITDALRGFQTKMAGAGSGRGNHKQNR